MKGLGIHSGREAAVTFAPLPRGSGIVFIKGGRKIPATIKQVAETDRGTTLGGIAVVEHLLAALNGLEIDDLAITVTGDELPIMDGSALPFAEALLKEGLVKPAKERDWLFLHQPIKVVDGEATIEARPYRGFKVDFMVDFPGIGEQRLTFDRAKDDFVKELAPARTFGYVEEFDLLKERGLARGASLDNALVLTQDGYLNQPRWPDELVRHKILDLLGDLMLLGRPLQAEIRAVKSGHKLNTELVRRILKP
jgi:UDP-3-O-[3-hydroxymyristoyl] N-acetylglucosamine deacetylase